jgi:hypothetical protein
MGRTIKLLTAIEVARIKAPGMHLVGDGLYLQVQSVSSRSWIYRYMLNGKARWAGLGSAADVSLADARTTRDEIRAQVRAGTDPVAVKRQRRQSAVQEKPKKMFRQVAPDYIANHEHSWKNDVHRAQWRSTMIRYVYPIIGDLPVDEISAFMTALRPRDSVAARALEFLVLTAARTGEV